MTMFSRNDKMPDPAPPAKPLASATPLHVSPPAPAPAPVETRRSPPPSSASHAPTSVSLISKSLKISGQLERTEDIHVEGEVDGDIRGVSVKVGHNAKIKGNVYGEEVELSGTVTGKIEARKVVLTSTARMCGDVIHQDIRIDSGAFIDGHCRPEYGKPDGKAHVVQKPGAAPREGFSSVKPTEARSIA
jgi:cytoskeletal protein CcmA (bactofilin family)